MKNLFVAIAVSAALLLAGCANKPAPEPTVAPTVKTKHCVNKKGMKKARKAAKYNK